jgi:hypothetical protein
LENFYSKVLIGRKASFDYSTIRYTVFLFFSFWKIQFSNIQIPGFGNVCKMFFLTYKIKPIQNFCYLGMYLRLIGVLGQFPIGWVCIVTSSSNSFLLVFFFFFCNMIKEEKNRDM